MKVAARLILRYKPRRCSFRIILFQSPLSFWKFLFEVILLDVTSSRQFSIEPMSFSNFYRGYGLKLLKVRLIINTFARFQNMVSYVLHYRRDYRIFGIA